SPTVGSRWSGGRQNETGSRDSTGPTRRPVPSWPHSLLDPAAFPMTQTARHRPVAPPLPIQKLRVYRPSRELLTMPVVLRASIRVMRIFTAGYFRPEQAFVFELRLPEFDNPGGVIW